MCTVYAEEHTRKQAGGVFLNTGSGVNLYICIHQLHQRILRYWPYWKLFKVRHVHGLICIVEYKTTQFDVWILKQCLLNPKFLTTGLISHRTNIIWVLYMTSLSVIIKLIQQTNHFSNDCLESFNIIVTVPWAHTPVKCDTENSAHYLFHTWSQHTV